MITFYEFIFVYMILIASSLVFLILSVAFNKKILSGLCIISFILITLFSGIQLYSKMGFANTEIKFISENFINLNNYFDDENNLIYFMIKEQHSNYIRLFMKKYENREKYEKDKKLLTQSKSSDGQGFGRFYFDQNRELSYKLLDSLEYLPKK